MNRVQIKFIKDALDQEHNLDKWEIDFVNDLADKEELYQLSEAQNSALNDIQRKLH